MKKIILILICSFSLNIVIAQIDTTSNDCLTTDIDTTEFQQLPWFDNNQFLENFLVVLVTLLLVQETEF